ncbi:MAG: hypothetical protein JNL21_03995 [Myxococcales bacterium]|nr:hypothetical protein [Myxococcales bacterium]
MRMRWKVSARARHPGGVTGNGADGVAWARRELEAEEAARRAAEAVLARQDERGAWRGVNDGGPMFLAATVVLLSRLGELDATTRAEAEQSLRSAQLLDGGLAPWPCAEQSNAEASVFLLAALRVLGASERDAAMQAARRRLGELGGARAAGPLGLTIGVLGDVVPARALPRLPPDIALAPGHDWAVARLFGVNALLPTHVLPFLWSVLRHGGLARPRTDRVAARLRDYLLVRQNPSGGIAGVPIFTLLGMLCLRAAGMSMDADPIQRGLAYVRRVIRRDVRGGLMVEPFTSEYWDTAHMVRALASMGEVRFARAAARGAAWLMDGQSSEASPEDWQTAPAGAPSSGGWSWQVGNESNPDIDTTAEVLSALGVYAGTSDAARRETSEAIGRGRAWLLAMQNSDGGWAAFSWGKPRPPRGALYLRSRGLVHRARSWLAENGDPSTADIVGRVLEGVARTDPPAPAWELALERATSFLAYHQETSGAWWGRWAINYAAGTAYVVSGLALAGIDAAHPCVRAGADWLLSRQNADGGWGEDQASYADPRAAGCGPSTVALTGLVAAALARARRASREDRYRSRLGAAQARAQAFLLARQRPDGWFEDSRCFSTMFPLRAYWLNDTYPTFFALEALLDGGRQCGGGST